MPTFSKPTDARSPCGGAAVIDWVSPTRSPSCVCSVDFPNRRAEPPRVFRRLHYLRELESSWEDRADIHPKFENGPCVWCSSTRGSTTPSGGRWPRLPHRFDRLPARMDAVDGSDSIRQGPPPLDKWWGVPAASAATCDQHAPAVAAPTSIFQGGAGVARQCPQHEQFEPHSSASSARRGCDRSGVIGCDRRPSPRSYAGGHHEVSTPSGIDIRCFGRPGARAARVAQTRPGGRLRVGPRAPVTPSGWAR